ncbi:MAG TPA: PQQ-binding-like beta-propeller repeat protein [Sedimentisphaerales bacterium]|nr:PQQ-binding-like beta-propeller repeat protein [Sedimentisphaerales bacterium]HRS11547.1 PQQ-binding-like beta-propeller repeat protein [Sedimentisphaerales bacterium]HRV48201.1 PQQ-binding-like beta-propeller repeat protein [Sedimentisphaerales bacterium]
MRSQARSAYQNPSWICLGIGVAVVLEAFGPAYGADWPNYRGPNYDGISDETGWRAVLPEGSAVEWKTSLGWGFASMAVRDGCVYAMGNVDGRDVLYCLDAATGQEKWKQSYPCPRLDKNHEGGPAATPTVEGDSVYVFSKNGDVLRLRAETGQVVWHKRLHEDPGVKELTWYFSGSPLIVDDLVILNAGTAGVALSKADGRVVWHNGKDAGGYATPVPYIHAGKKCVALFGCQHLFGLEAATGKILWRFEWKTSYDINSADPIIDGDHIFISSGYNKGCALLKLGDGKVTEVYSNRNMRNQCNCSVLWKGYVYGFDGQVGGSGKLTCLDLETGQIKWAQGGLGTGSLMLADGKLIVLGERGKLVIAEATPDGYKELASAEILDGKCWTVPVLANGRIYARNAAGDLVCVNVGGGN